MSDAGTVQMVTGFQHLPGSHCGSTALRDLLNYHGASISEELAFGLGAGPCFYYIPMDGQSPSRFTNGRTGRLEERFLELTGAPLRMRTERDPDAAWAMAAATIDEGHPAILLTDLYHLDHYGSSAHFPGHAVTLVGYDDTYAYLADTGFEEIQRTSLEGLKRARHEQHPFYPLAGHVVDLPPGEAIDPDELRAAASRAIEGAAQLMHEPQMGELEGLPALRSFAAEVGSWPEATGDWQWCARFNYQVIERRGTGGGNFRAIYARFLEEVGREEAALATSAAERWTGLATALYEASERDTPDPASWRQIGDCAERVLAAEERLWQAL
jgi:hypothetical protein